MSVSTRIRTCGVVLLVSCFATPSVCAAAGTDLVAAARQADRAALREALAASSDVNVAEADGTTALHWAVYHDDAESAALLIEYGASVRATNRYGTTVLSLACVNGNAQLIGLLLKAGADSNAPLPSGETPLMTAARTGKADAVRLLLAHGADVNAKENAKEQTALMWAAAENNTAIMHALVEAGADVLARTVNGFTPLLFAVREGQLDAVRALLDVGADPNDVLPTGHAALLVAVSSAHYEVAGALLDPGADPNADGAGFTVLHQLAWTRRNTTSNNPLPVQTDTVPVADFVRKLLARGANINARLKKEPGDGYTNYLDRIGATPFLLATKNVDLELMRVLLANGADPKMATDHGATSLMVAAGVGIYSPGQSPGSNNEIYEAVKICLELGVDPTAADGNGETALHGAALRGADRAVQLLVDADSRLDVRNKSGWTPWKIADGVQYYGTFKSQPATAILLERLMKERGVWTERERESAVQ